MKHLIDILTVLCITALTTATVTAEDWPQFRGPTGQGLSKETHLPAVWSTTKNVAWTVDIPGKGWSSPIVWKGRIYLTTAETPPAGRGNDRSLRALCLDAKSGKTRWNVEVFQQKNESTQRIHGKNSHASATPVTDGKFLYVHFGAQGTACLTLDGKTVWKNRELVYRPQHGNGGSPILVDDVLIVSCDGSDVQYIVALDKTSGKIRWKKDRPATPGGKKFSFSTPLAITQGGKTQIISPATDQVISYEPATGKEQWVVHYDGFSVIPRPVYAHGLVFLSTSYMRPQMLAIQPGGDGDVTKTHLKWSIRRGAPNTPSPLVVGNFLYFVSDRGVATCADPKTGKVIWQQRIGGNYSASPIFADGKIYFQSEQGNTTVIKPGAKYTEIARNSLKERTLASYAVADGALFIRTDSKLYRIQQK